MYESPPSYHSDVGYPYVKEIPLQGYADPPPYYCPPPVVVTPLPPPTDTIILPPQNSLVIMRPLVYRDYLGCSIFHLVCCCFPIGLAALIFSCKTQNSTSNGDMTSAASNSRVAFILNMVALSLGLLIYFSVIAYSSYMIASGKSVYVQF